MLATIQNTERQAIEEFLYAETRCLDEKDWDGWLAHYSKDVVFWMPAWDDDDKTVEDPQVPLRIGESAHATPEIQKGKNPILFDWGLLFGTLVPTPRVLAFQKKVRRTKVLRERESLPKTKKHKREKEKGPATG